MKQIKLIIILLAFSTTLSAQWELVDSTNIYGPYYYWRHLLKTDTSLVFFDIESIFSTNSDGENFDTIIYNVDMIGVEYANSHLYCATSKEVIKFDDYGETIDTVFDEYPSVDCFEFTETEFYVGKLGKIYKSIDYGNIWETYYIDFDPRSILNINGNVFLVVIGVDIYIYKSTNMSDWEEVITIPMPDSKDNLHYNLLTGRNEENIIFTRVFANSGILYYSTNGGESFQELTEFENICAYKNINNQNVIGIKETIADTAYYKIGVSKTFENWAVYDVPFKVADIEAFGDYLYAVDNTGYIYRTNLANHVGISEEHSGFNVQVFPNPATSVINIECNNKINNILIYNTLGQIVKQGNNYSYNQINVSDLPSGVYILNIQTETNSVSEKIIIE